MAANGQLQQAESFRAPDDAAAVAKARACHLSGHAMELWDGGRLVGRFSRLGDYTPGARS